MTSISDNIKHFSLSIPADVKLVAVSKTKPVEDILEAYKAGHKIFGENRVQEILDKYPDLPEDINIHMIGHLQSNKVKYIIDKVHMIESVDSIKLLRIIDKEAKKKGLKVNILLQFHIADEESKYGFDIDQIIDLYESSEINELNGVNVCGVMGMATFTDDMDKVRLEFRQLNNIFTRLKSAYYANDPNFREISMGMSGDFRIAIEEGSSMVRIGSAIFGARNCKI
jgi:pyridoxal phosphate enzyme (YggS family)